MAADGLMKIGELARKTGTTLRTIRYYEQLGLINHSARTKGGFHLYFPDECHKIEFIKRLQLLGTPLIEIRRLLARRREGESGAGTAREIIESLCSRFEQIEARVAVYRQMQEAIRQTLGILEVCKECPLKPSKDVCCRCVAITSMKEVPLPMQALIAAS